MNLIPVPVHSNNPITVTCIACGGRAYQAHGTVYADLDGAAFQAYYCADCALERQSQPVK